MKLSKWARVNGVYPQTAYRWFREDRMPVPARRLESGTIWVDAIPAGGCGRVVVYARVSSHDRRRDLDRQVARLTGWATANGHAVGEVVTGARSGLDGKRPKLRRVLPDPSAGVVVAGRRDRLARFGAEHLEAALAAHGRKVAGGACKKGLNLALSDAALAEIRRMLTYKCAWYGSTLVEAGRFFPSSKLCSGCGRRKPNLALADRAYECDHCGLRIDRDLNAAVNLAQLGETRHQVPGAQGPAGSGPVAGRGATRETEPARAGDAGGRETSTPHRQPPGKTGTASPQGEAA